ncbi:class E sortase [Streptomyces purpureus]|uniref:Class E sortase n=1 Tax=Streptomyces purpureus TaxID=1951 RepID=A0A918LMK9_9ACTN|nr:class E sortase [Streptomyces purpureus]GGT20996.1 hypothetical protein GCM10014713_12360 [Streptomyces purpureus]
MTTGSPWFRATNPPQEPQRPDPGPYGQEPYEPVQPVPQLYEQPTPQLYEQPAPQQYGQPAPQPYEPAPQAYDPIPPGPYDPGPYDPGPYEPDAYGQGTPEPEPWPSPEPVIEPDPAPAPEPEPAPLPDLGPGRAERRRAAKARGRRGAAAPPPPDPAPGRPLTRVEARRAARAAKESLGVIASRFVGELFITFGVVMLLFVTYQLWWTNVQAGLEVDKAKNRITDDWAKGRKPDAFEPGQGFALMHIPKLDVVVPIAEGISKSQVLDRGMVGHYSEGALKTAMPSDKQGNFAVAGHRNTHGEPFRYINQLSPGDPIVVETQDAYYTYAMASILPQTSPSNVAVIGPVPPGSGFTQPGRYITLTTCTPEFTSTYRMIVWGKMVEERPRSKGKPDALVG